MAPPNNPIQGEFLLVAAVPQLFGQKWLSLALLGGRYRARQKHCLPHG